MSIGKRVLAQEGIKIKLEGDLITQYSQLLSSWKRDTAGKITVMVTPQGVLILESKLDNRHRPRQKSRYHVSAPIKQKRRYTSKVITSVIEFQFSKMKERQASLNNYRLLEAVEDEGLVRAMMEVENETPLSRDAALAELERE